MFSWNSIFRWHCFRATHTRTHIPKTSTHSRRCVWMEAFLYIYCLWLTSDKNSLVPQFAKIATLSFYPTLEIDRIFFSFSWTNTITCVRMDALLHVAVKISNALCTRLFGLGVSLSVKWDGVWCATYTYVVQWRIVLRCHLEIYSINFASTFSRILSV